MDETTDTTTDPDGKDEETKEGEETDVVVNPDPSEDEQGKDEGDGGKVDEGTGDGSIDEGT